MSKLPSVATASHCRHCRIFELCEPERLSPDRDLAARIVMRRRSLRRGDTLYRMGEPFRSLTVVCRGSVKTSVVTPEGGWQMTGFYLPGEIVGASALGGRVFNEEAATLEPTTVCEVLFNRLEDLSEHFPAMRNYLFKLLGAEIRAGQDRLWPLLGRRGAPERLAGFLLALSQRYQERGFDAGSFPLSMKRCDVGNYLGLAKETVTRLFARFEEDGLLSVQARQVRIHDLARLRQLADPH
jgi:CRP/FNR family transcriptional regulator